MIKIIGAGLAGLSAAYHLKKEYEIFEKESRLGGLCKSENFDGFVFDHSIHILYSSNSYAEKLIKEVLLKDNFVSQERRSFVFYKNVFVKYPFQANTCGLPLDVVKECVLGVIKAKYEPKGKVKNFKDWIIATFGEGIAKHFMIPYNERQWAIPSSMMHFNWIAGRVPIPNIEEVLDGALGIQKKQFGPNAQFWYPTKGGIESLPKGFLPFVKNIKLSNSITRINIKKKEIEVNGEKSNYDKLISTIPLPLLVNLIDEVSPEIRNVAQDLMSNVIHTVNIGIDREAISDKHWVYMPENDFIFHRISFPMNFSPNNTPEGKSSITAEISASKFKKIDENKIVEKTIDDLQKANFINKDDNILFKKVMKLDPAYIIYDLNHEQNVKKILLFLKKNDILSCGRFGEWEYLNMDHSILTGKKAAELVNSE